MWELSKRQRQVVTLGYCIAFVALGWIIGSLGPTLLGLADQTATDVESLGFLFTTRSIGYVLMSSIIGRVLDARPEWAHRICAAGLALLGTTFVWVPTMTTPVSLGVWFVAVGLGAGFVDVVGNTCINWVWGDEVNQPMQLLHFAFGVGAATAPMVVSKVIQVTNGVKMAYVILGAMQLPCALLTLLIPAPGPNANSGAKKEEGEAGEEASGKEWKLAAATSAFLLVYVGIEVGYGGWISPYVVRAGLGSDIDAANAGAVFWTAFTVGRLLGVPLGGMLKPETMIRADLLVCLVVSIALTVLPHSLMITNIGSAAYGLGMASLFPTALAYPPAVGIPLSGTSFGYIVVGASLGELLIPMSIGHLFKAFGPNSLFSFSVLCSAIAFAIASVIFYIGGPSQKSSKPKYEVLDESVDPTEVDDMNPEL